MPPFKPVWYPEFQPDWGVIIGICCSNPYGILLSGVAVGGGFRWKLFTLLVEVFESWAEDLTFGSSFNRLDTEKEFDLKFFFSFIQSVKIPWWKRMWRTGKRCIRRRRPCFISRISILFFHHNMREHLLPYLVRCPKSEWIKCHRGVWRQWIKIRR